MRLVSPDELKSKTVFLVEATSFEMSRLCVENAGKVDWVDNKEGRLVHIGSLGTRPVKLHLTWATINGCVVCFYEATSELVDWDMIDKWIAQTFPRIPKEDASNFSHCLQHIAAIKKD
jgi:hypothetical protein